MRPPVDFPDLFRQRGFGQFEFDVLVVVLDAKTGPEALVLAEFVEIVHRCVVHVAVGERPDGAEVVGLGGFDTLGRRLDLQLPKGYQPAEVYALFQWLDDDRTNAERVHRGNPHPHPEDEAERNQNGDGRRVGQDAGQITGLFDHRP